MASPLILVLPGVISTPEGESALRPLPPALAKIVPESRLIRLAPAEGRDSWWLPLFGLTPDAFPVEKGPLLASAFRIDPPLGSVAMVLRWIGREAPGPPPTQAEVAELALVLPRLATKTLVPLLGAGTNHVLLDLKGESGLRTTAPEDFTGPWQSHLPEGDRESALRLLIDDSINLLSELEMNRRRVGEGIPPLDCLWPCHPGLVRNLPNVVVRDQIALSFASCDPLLAGLARSLGFATPRKDLPNQGQMIKHLLARGGNGIYVFPDQAELLASDEEGPSRIAHDLEELSRAVIGPAVEDDPSADLTLILPGQRGLALRYRAEAKGSQIYPLDERSLDEKGVPQHHLHEVMRHVFATLAASSDIPK